MNTIKFRTNFTELPSKPLITNNNDGTFTLERGDYVVSANDKTVTIRTESRKEMVLEAFHKMINEIKES